MLYISWSQFVDVESFHQVVFQIFFGEACLLFFCSLRLPNLVSIQGSTITFLLSKHFNKQYMIVVTPRLLSHDGSCHIALLYVMPVYLFLCESALLFVTSS
jgi:hypothetical protein